MLADLYDLDATVWCMHVGFPSSRADGNFEAVLGGCSPINLFVTIVEELRDRTKRWLRRNPADSERVTR